MSILPVLLATVLGLSNEPIKPGDHTRSVERTGRSRPYLLHVPRSYDPRKKTPLVLALHPFATNGPLMAVMSGLSETAEREGFLVAYPNGSGKGPGLYWNVGQAVIGASDDLGYLDRVLDDIA